MRIMQRTVLSCLVWFCTLVFAQHPQEFLPADNEVNDLIVDAGTACWSGTASSSAELFTVVNGEASNYTEHGFVAAACEGYTGTNGTLCVELYDQGELSNSLTVYGSYYLGDYYTLLDTIGDSARLMTAGMSTYSLELAAGQYFMRFVSTKSEGALDDILTMAFTVMSNAGLTRTASLPVKNSYHLSSTPIGGGWRIPAPPSAQILIHDSRGRVARRLSSGTDPFKEQQQVLFWDGTDDAGRPVARGRYYLRTTTPATSTLCPILVVR